MKLLLFFLVGFLLTFPAVHGLAQKLPKNHGKLDTQLFVGPTDNKFLVVAFGGSEGGNTFAQEKTITVRKAFYDRGFHFLAIGYHGSKGLPKTIDRISLDAINDTIESVLKKLVISINNTVLVGASRGGELVLNLASRLPYQGVIAMVPGNVTVPYQGGRTTTSSWVFEGQEVPYLGLSADEVTKTGWHETLSSLLPQLDENNPAIIPIEKTEGFILLTSGKNDQLWPSWEMCNLMMKRLEYHNFPFPNAHLVYDGGHNPSTHWPDVFLFLDERLGLKK